MTVEAEKMKQASEKRFKAAEIRQNVRVPIPELDRGRAGHRNLIGVVLEVKDGFYKIGTKNCVLKSLYSRGQFDLCSEVFITAADVPETEVSVRQAATAASVGTGQGFQKCSCSGKCINNRCKCRAAGKLCNSRCHGSNACTNE